MFVLRKLEAEGHINVDLGERYKVIHRKTHYKEFNKIQKMFEKDLEIFAYVTTADDIEEGMRIEPLRKGNKYYIVFQNGNTFERINEIT